jgi:hypothetical protein
MAIGNKGSYATVTPVRQDYIGNAGARNEANAFKYREEARLKAEKEQAVKAKKLQDAQIALENVTTPFANVNNGILETGRMIVQKNLEMFEKKERGEISEGQYLMFKQNAEMVSKQITERGKGINGQLKEITEGAEKGIYSPDFLEDGLKLGGAFEKGQFLPKINDDGTVEYLVYETDENGNKVPVSDWQPVGSFGVNEFTPVRKFNVDEEIKTFVANHPLQTTAKIGNNKVTTETLLNAKENEFVLNSINLKADADLSDKDKLININFKLTGQKEKDVSKIDKEALKQKYVEELKNSYKEEMKEVSDFKGAEYQRKLAKDNKKIKENAPMWSEQTETNELLGKPKQGFKAKSVKNGYKFNTIKTKEGVLSNAIVEYATVVEGGDGKEYVKVVLSVPDIKSSYYEQAKKDRLADAEFVNQLFNKIENKIELTPEEENLNQLILSKYSTGVQNKKVPVVLTDALAVNIKPDNMSLQEFKDSFKDENSKEKQESSETPQQRIERLKKAKGLK